MKQKIKRLFSLAVAIIMLATMLPLADINWAPKAVAVMSLSSYNVGDIIQYGSYPQSEVKDKALIAKLEAVGGEWKSYGYMITYTTESGKELELVSDYMQYKDVTVDKDSYRAVKFSKYRSAYSAFSADTSTEYTNQNDNGYYINTTYWFKFEPINWRVLDPQIGLVLCEDIIDSQMYLNRKYYHGEDSSGLTMYWSNEEYTILANDYSASSLREWLNNDFYNLSFTDTEQENIATTTISNYSITNRPYDKTSDKIFILNFKDIFNTNYGFDNGWTYDINRRAAGSDYAKCQGLFVSKNADFITADGRNSSPWRLRSAGYYSDYASGVTDAGYPSDYGNIFCTDFGIRPALVLNSQPYVDLSSSNEPATQPDDEKPQKDNSLLGRIKAFFQLIAEWFRNLFKR